MEEDSVNDQFRRVLEHHHNYLRENKHPSPKKSEHPNVADPNMTVGKQGGKQSGDKHLSDDDDSTIYEPEFSLAKLFQTIQSHINDSDNESRCLNDLQKLTSIVGRDLSYVVMLLKRFHEIALRNQQELENQKKTMDTLSERLQQFGKSIEAQNQLIQQIIIYKDMDEKIGYDEVVSDFFEHCIDTTTTDQSNTTPKATCEASPTKRFEDDLISTLHQPTVSEYFPRLRELIDIHKEMSLKESDNGKKIRQDDNDKKISDKKIGDSLVSEYMSRFGRKRSFNEYVIEQLQNTILLHNRVFKKLIETIQEGEDVVYSNFIDVNGDLMDIEDDNDIEHDNDDEDSVGETATNSPTHSNASKHDKSIEN